MKNIKKIKTNGSTTKTSNKDEAAREKLAAKGKNAVAGCPEI